MTEKRCPTCGGKSSLLLTDIRINELQSQLAESQAREARLKDGLSWAIRNLHMSASENQMLSDLLAIPSDDTALKMEKAKELRSMADSIHAEYGDYVEANQYYAVSALRRRADELEGKQ